MSKSVKRQVVLAGTEADYRQFSNPTAADAVLIQELTVKENKTMLQRNPIIGSRAPVAEVPGAEVMDFTGTVEVKGSGTPGTPPEMGVFLKACGLRETIDPGVDVRYSYGLVPDEDDSLSMIYWEDGTQNQMEGMRGTFQLTLAPDDFLKAVVTMMGHKRLREDGTQPAPVFNATTPPVPLAIPFSIGGFTPELGSFSINTNHTISKPRDLTQPNGYGQFAITDTPLTAEILITATSVAEKDVFDNWDNGVQETVVLGPFGPPGNRISLTLPAFSISDINRSEEENLMKYTLAGRVNESVPGASDLFELVFA